MIIQASTFAVNLGVLIGIQKNVNKDFSEKLFHDSPSLVGTLSDLQALEDAYTG